MSSGARKAAAFMLVALAALASLQAQSPAPSPTPACRAPEFHQFDFWLGKWKVIGPKGNQVGTSEISRVSEGCAIREQWTSASGQGGVSLNYYDAGEQQWHQDWVGGDGTILHLHGGLVGDAMVLSGEIKGAKATVKNRITWTPLPKGKVKQEWATSEDGVTWKTSFVGIYEH